MQLIERDVLEIIRQVFEKLEPERRDIGKVGVSYIYPRQDEMTEQELETLLQDTQSRIHSVEELISVFPPIDPDTVKDLVLHMRTLAALDLWQKIIGAFESRMNELTEIHHNIRREKEAAATNTDKEYFDRWFHIVQLSDNLFSAVTRLVRGNPASGERERVLADVESGLECLKQQIATYNVYGLLTGFIPWIEEDPFSSENMLRIEEAYLKAAPVGITAPNEPRPPAIDGLLVSNQADILCRLREFDFSNCTSHQLAIEQQLRRKSCVPESTQDKLNLGAEGRIGQLQRMGKELLKLKRQAFCYKAVGRVLQLLESPNLTSTTPGDRGRSDQKITSG